MGVIEKRSGFVAPESEKTKRARQKLLKQWESKEAQITPKAIQETVGKIHKWIADNGKNRVRVKGKSIRLFNQNQDAAKISHKVREFAEKMSLDIRKPIS